MPHFLDLGPLRNLFREDQALLAEWIVVYLEEAPVQYQRLSSCLAANDAVGLTAAAHELRPQAHYLGCTRMLELLIDIGQRAHTEGTAACTVLVSELLDLCITVDAELRAVQAPARS